MKILCDLNKLWKLGQKDSEWQLWRLNAANGRYFLDESYGGTRRGLLERLEEKAIYPSREAQKVLDSLPERLTPIAPDVEISN